MCHLEILLSSCHWWQQRVLAPNMLLGLLSPDDMLASIRVQSTSATGATLSDLPWCIRHQICQLVKTCEGSSSVFSPCAQWSAALRAAFNARPGFQSWSGVCSCCLQSCQAQMTHCLSLYTPQACIAVCKQVQAVHQIAHVKPTSYFQT